MHQAIQMVVMLVILGYVSQKIMKKMKEIKEKKNTCMICLSPLTTPTDPGGVKPYETPCRHNFHYDCLTDWYVSNMKNLPPEFVHQALKKDENELIYTCPLCRRSLRQDFFKNMMCKSDGYEYKKTFHGDLFGESFSVDSPEECAKECTSFSECHAYRIDYHSDQNSLRCRLYQPHSHLSATKKKNTKMNHHPPKHVAHNVCRKKTDEKDRETEIIDSLPITTIKYSFGLVKAIMMLFQQAIQNLWMDVKQYYMKRKRVNKLTYLKDAFSWIIRISTTIPFFIIGLLCGVCKKIYMFMVISGFVHFFLGGIFYSIRHLSHIHEGTIDRQVKELSLTDQDGERNLTFQQYLPSDGVSYFFFLKSQLSYAPVIETYFKKLGYFQISKIITCLFIWYSTAVLFLFSVVDPFASISGWVLILLSTILLISDLTTGFSI